MTKIRTADEVLAQQRAEHGMLPRVPTTPAPVSSDAAIDAFLLEHAGSGGARFIKFAKGHYTGRDGEEIATGMQLVAVYDQIQKLAGLNSKGKATPQNAKWDRYLAASCHPGAARWATPTSRNGKRV